MKIEIKRYLIALAILTSTLSISFGSTRDQISEANEAPVAKVTTPPEVIEMPAPLYPKKLYKKKIKGEVLVEVVLTANGTPTRIRILSASHKLFGPAAKMCVERTKFKPATVDGKPVAVKMRFPVYFVPGEKEEED